MSKLKKIIIPIAMVMFCLMVIGCSPGGSTSDQAAQTGQQASAAEGAATESEDTDHRIVSLTVAGTEILDALELDLVGIPTSYKELPERYAGVTELGNAKSPDMERLQSLKPTEVISVTTIEYDLAPKFEETGLNVRFLDLTSLAAMKQDILALGEEYDRQDQAEAIVATFDDKVAEIKAKTAGKEAPSVLILLGVPGSYLVATEYSYIGDLVKIVGGENIVQGEDIGEDVEFLASNTEYLYESNPDVILRLAHGMPEEVVEMFDEEFRTNDIWKHFNAVKNDRVYDLEELLFPTTGTIRADEALEELANLLYPSYDK